MSSVKYAYVDSQCRLFSNTFLDLPILFWNFSFLPCVCCFQAAMYLVDLFITGDLTHHACRLPRLGSAASKRQWEETESTRATTTSASLSCDT